MRGGGGEERRVPRRVRRAAGHHVPRPFRLRIGVRLLLLHEVQGCAGESEWRAESARKRRRACGGGEALTAEESEEAAEQQRDGDEDDLTAYAAGPPRPCGDDVVGLPLDGHARDEEALERKGGQAQGLPFEQAPISDAVGLKSWELHWTQPRSTSR